MLEKSEEALVVQQSEQVEGRRGGSEGKERPGQVFQGLMGGLWAGPGSPP